MASATSSRSIPANPKALAHATAGATEHLTFSLVLKKAAGNSLGIDVNYSTAAAWTRNGVFIARVFENGLVASWNAESREPYVVQTGDFIFQVNEVFGETTAIIQEMKVTSDLIIHVLRRAGGSSPTASPTAASSQPALLPPPAHPAPPPPTNGVKEAKPEAEERVKVQEKPATQERKAEDKQERQYQAHPNGESLGEVRAGARTEVQSGARTEVQPQSSAAAEDSLLPQLIELSDEALAGLICVALQRRPWLRAGVLAPFEDGGEKGDQTSWSVPAMQ